VAPLAQINSVLCVATLERYRHILLSDCHKPPPVVWAGRLIGHRCASSSLYTP